MSGLLGDNKTTSDQAVTDPYQYGNRGGMSETNPLVKPEANRVAANSPTKNHAVYSNDSGGPTDPFFNQAGSNNNQSGNLLGDITSNPILNYSLLGPLGLLMGGNQGSSNEQGANNRGGLFSGLFGGEANQSGGGVLGSSMLPLMMANGGMGGLGGMAGALGPGLMMHQLMSQLPSGPQTEVEVQGKDGKSNWNDGTNVNWVLDADGNRTDQTLEQYTKDGMRHDIDYAPHLYDDVSRPTNTEGYDMYQAPTTQSQLLASPYATYSEGSVVDKYGYGSPQHFSYLDKESNTKHTTPGGNTGGSEYASSEAEAQDIMGGGSSLHGSSFGSMGEAQSVADDGWGSDAHFDSIDSQFDGLGDDDSGDSGGGGSYIATAATQALGEEGLTVFNNWRDHMHEVLPSFTASFGRYRVTAPKIVAEIDTKEDSKGIYKSIWDSYLKPIHDLIKNKDDDGALKEYKTMVRELSNKYLKRGE